MAVNIGPKIGIDGEAEYRKQLENIIQQAKTLNSEMKLVSASFDENTSAVDKARAMSEQYSKQIEAQEQRVKMLQDMLEKSAGKYGENATQTLKWQQAVNEAQASLKKMQSNLQSANAQLDAAETHTSAFSSSMKSAGNNVYLFGTKLKTNLNETKALKSEYRDAKQEVVDLTKAFNSSIKETGAASEESRELADRLEEAKNKTADLKTQLSESVSVMNGFKKAASAVGTGLKTIGSAVGTAFTGLVKGTAAALTAASGAIVSLGKIGLEYNSQMESYTSNFKVMLGSEEAAIEKVESLKDMAASTPFEMAGLADATQQLLAFGVANEDTNTYLQQLGDISLGDADKLNSLVSSFGKMNSTGKVTLEYINMMAEQGFNPLNIIAQQTGETMEQLYERLSDGGVAFDEIKNAMAIATSEGGQFYKGMEEASKTTEGMISTLKDNATALIGEVFEPISQSLKEELLPAAIDSIDQLSTAFEEDGVEGMIAAAGEIVGETIGTFTKNLPQFASSATSMVKSLLNGLADNSDAIVDGAVETVDVLIDGFIDMLPDILATGSMILLKLAAGLIGAIPDLIAKVPEIISSVKQAFLDRASDFKEIGKNIVLGIGEGLASLGNWLKNKVSSLLGGTVSAAENELDIHSPSKRYAAIGKNMALGVGVGWEDTFGTIQNGITKTLDLGVSSLRRQTVNPSSSGNAINMGGIEIKVYGAQGQDVNQLANVIMNKIEMAVRQKEAVFGV